jgi:hypothetical protein
VAAAAGLLVAGAGLSSEQAVRLRVAAASAAASNKGVVRSYMVGTSKVMPYSFGQWCHEALSIQ